MNCMKLNVAVQLDKERFHFENPSMQLLQIKAQVIMTLQVHRQEQQLSVVYVNLFPNKRNLYKATVYEN